MNLNMKQSTTNYNIKITEFVKIRADDVFSSSKISRAISTE